MVEVVEVLEALFRVVVQVEVIQEASPATACKMGAQYKVVFQVCPMTDQLTFFSRCRNQSYATGPDIILYPHSLLSLLELLHLFWGQWGTVRRLV